VSLPELLHLFIEGFLPGVSVRQRVEDRGNDHCVKEQRGERKEEVSPPSPGPDQALANANPRKYRPLV
jgi:hypothetical protein